MTLHDQQSMSLALYMRTVFCKGCVKGGVQEIGERHDDVMSAGSAVSADSEKCVRAHGPSQALNDSFSLHSKDMIQSKSVLDKLHCAVYYMSAFVTEQRCP